MRTAAFFVLLPWLGLLPSRGAETPMAEVVVSTRYLQRTGPSHAHLYLYRADGKLLRQLTADDGGQDQNPVFSPDGATIVFTRSHDAGATEFCSIEPRGGNLHVLAAAPGWYRDAQPSPSFTDPPRNEKVPNPPEYRSADGKVAIVLTLKPGDPANDINGEGHGKSYALDDGESKYDDTLGDLPGFVGLWNLLECPATGGSGRFLITDPLRAAFFNLHLNSTDGDTVFALDIKEKQFVRLSPNYAVPFPLPGEAGFLTLTEQRYVPFGDGRHTANCSYVEHWDAHFHKVRYAREKAAAGCGGASMYRPGKIPAVIVVRAATAGR